MVIMDGNSNTNDSHNASDSNSSGMEYAATLELSLDGFENILMPELTSHLMAVDERTVADDSVIIQHMDICQPLTTLKLLLERRLGVDLAGYTFILQNNEHLSANKNLVAQCVQGEGIVQINLEIQPNFRRINILDVLKPADDYIGDVKSPLELPVQETPKVVDTHKVKHWEVNLKFKQEQERLKIPTDPELWEVVHVKHWLQWAVRQFNLANLKLSDWEMTGKDLFKLTINDFQKLVPKDPGDIFWTHLELLRQMKLIATIKRNGFPVTPDTKMTIKQQLVPSPSPIQATDACRSNNQVQLWQFLLDLLTNREHRTIIHWIGKEGEFKLSDPDGVAQLWGVRKNKPRMNYEKLSRALRYYYDGDMICKVPGKRFVYRFVCDLRQLVGYDAVELANLVNHGNPQCLS